MFVIFLRFSEQRSRASALMAGHNAWLQNGFDSGIFLVSGSLPSQAGGMILAHSADRSEVEAFIAKDPFVTDGVVTAEIHEVKAGRTDERLAFLMG